MVWYRLKKAETMLSYGMEAFKMVGKPRGELPKVQLSLSIDSELAELLRKERNMSSLVEELLKDFYKKPLEQIRTDEAAKIQEELNKTTTYTCMSCFRAAFKSEWLEKGGYCPLCGASNLLDFFSRKFPEVVGKKREGVD